MKQGRLIGVGLGPGDPELLTVKAVKAIGSAPVIAFFAKKGRRGNAREIADRWIPSDRIELPLYYPMTTEVAFDDPLYVASLRCFYEATTEMLAGHLEAGSDVALLAEGDPLFYSSFMHLYVRLRERFETEIVPGITGMAGCWGAAGAPMAWGDDVLTVLPGTLAEEDLVIRLIKTDAAVIMKLGANLPKVRRAIIRADLLAHAIYVERGTMAAEKVIKLAERGDEDAPYFSMILIPGNGRRP
ncbi:precorrin-2 C(20)-methyltransferase [Methylovirgula sp. HY1]|uniref:precorrin-2 C(20)-methyltransferase n=1 Tax=Methylovirgula sp. HY1 TaxID=2822761 RepID=UPI001C5B552B|nr:precorrin-2 C(20)-methyltransferase [Methylovirgula sp. HY1]QXX76223.1 Precorrin-2 C(20)-methyltransferase [Methylovirgula sp. HY1]